MTETAHKTLAEALAAFQAEDNLTFAKTKTAKVKMKTGGEYTYKYADLGDILPVVRPLLAKHGLSWSSKPGSNDARDLVLTYRLLHASGEKDEGEMLLGVDRGCKPQELGSAITYARRYALTAQLNIATEEDDDGQAAQAAPRQTARANGTPPEPIVDKGEIAKLTEAAGGLSVSKIRLAFAACNVPVPDEIGEHSFDRVPKDKAPLLAEALAGATR